MTAITTTIPTMVSAVATINRKVRFESSDKNQNMKSMNQTAHQKLDYLTKCITIVKLDIGGP